MACTTLRKAPHPRAAWPILKQSWLLRCLVPAAPPAATRVRLSSNYPGSGLGGGRIGFMPFPVPRAASRGKAADAYASGAAAWVVAEF